MKQITLLLCGLFLSTWVMKAQQLPSSPAPTRPVREAAAKTTENEGTRRTLTALRIPDDEKIVVDGRLDEPAWKRAVPATDFRQQDPHNGAPPTERTEVRIIYNSKSLYMGIICFDDEPNRELRYQMRRDQFLQSDDRFMWVFDPFQTGQNGYYFETNPSGLMGDALLSPAGQNRAWDGIWTLHVRRTKIGWTIEVEIPFLTLNFPPNSTTWGVNFQRTVRRKNEEDLWTGWGRNQGLRRLSNAGLLEGLNENVHPGIGLQVQPYVRLTSGASPITGQPQTITSGTGGIDLSYNLTSGLRAIFTTNTDFTNTTVDQRHVNLTRFPLYYPEQRTFFVEGADYFDFGSVPLTGSSQSGGIFSRPEDDSVVPIFTRAIGLLRNRPPQKIDYGAKLTGQTGRQDIGLLFVKTGTDQGVPGEDFLALRVKRRMFKQSYVGALYTLRREPGGPLGSLQTFGADFRLATSTFMHSKNLAIGGWILHNTNPFHTGHSSAYGLQVDYPNDRWNTGMLYRVVQENFDPAIGFVQRTGYRGYYPYLNFSPRPHNNRFIRQFGFTADESLLTDMHNRFLTGISDFTVFDVSLQSQDSLSVHVIPEYERLRRDFPIYPGIVLPSGAEYNFVRYRVTASTANRRKIAITPSVEWGGFYGGTRRQINLDTVVRVRPGIFIYASNEWDRVELPQGKFSVMLYRVSPELQFNQWISLVNTVQYDTISRNLGWQALFRWIIKPGDDLYFVYMQNWLNDPVLNRFTLLSRQAATKFVYTHRF